MKKFFDYVALIWRIPFSLASLFFYRFNRWCLQRAEKNKLSLAVKAPALNDWVGLSEILRSQNNLPLVMVTGPRWNCHAMIAFVRSIHVEKQIVIDVMPAYASATEWTLIIYNDVYGVSHYFSSRQELTKIHIDLPAGMYRINCRYYHGKEEVRMPAISVDGKNLIPSADLSREFDDYQRYLSNIKNKFSWFYFANHYYIYHLLSWRKWFSAERIKKEFLPVGNPETEFRYGVAEKNQCIQVELSDIIVNNFNVYITFYNRCSFPVFWETVLTKKYASQPLICDGFYLIRLHAKKDSAAEISANQLKLVVL